MTHQRGTFVLGMGFLITTQMLMVTPSWAENNTWTHDLTPVAGEWKLAPGATQEHPEVAKAPTDFEPVDVFGEVEGHENDPDDVEDDVSGEGDAGADVPGVSETPSPSGLKLFPDLSDEELQFALENDPASLGSLSIGSPGGGRLKNGVQMPTGPYWEVMSPHDAYATRESVEYLKLAIESVNMLYPGAPKMSVGDWSREGGGPLRPHRSHMAGRDVDVGFYYANGISSRRFLPGSAQNLDLARDWAFLRSLLVFTDVELILVDRGIQKVLYDYALSIGEDQEWLDHLFQFRSRTPHAKIQHARGHRNHFHIRFYSPMAQELGRRAYPFIVKGKEKEDAERPAVVMHQVRKGESIGKIAKLYGTSAKAILRANGLKTGSLRVGKAYVIPNRGRSMGALKLAKGPIVIPARVVPPFTPDSLARLDWGTPVVSVARRTPQEVQALDKAEGEVAANDAADADGEADDATPDQAPEKAVVSDLAHRAKAEKLAKADKATNAKAPKAEKLAKAGKAKNEGRKVSYKVRSGDNLWTIAKRHKVNVADLRRWNSLSRDHLKLGQTLVIYLGSVVSMTP